MSSQLRVSILICAKNEESNIPTLLISLANQTVFQQISEIVLADNQSTDRTIEVSKEIAETYQLPLRILPMPENNIGKTRNVLVNEAKEDYVAFVDADCKVEPHWLQLLLAHFSSLSKFDSQLVGVGGPNRTPGKNFFQKILNANLEHGWLHGFSAQGYAQKKRQKKDHLPTTNALFLKSAILEAGNFSAQFARVGEDLDLGLRLRKKNFSLQQMPGPVVINDCATNMRQWASRMFRFGVAQGLTFGRRLSFVTSFLVACSFLIPFLIIFPETVRPVALAALTFTLVIAQPVPAQSFHSNKRVKAVLSYLLAPAVYWITALFYFLGFYWGLVQRTQLR
jgi:cellulose synthase/poly-beta-1,6-N-acetylglucosamine synthase-like glycosyltransferase